MCIQRIMKAGENSGPLLTILQLSHLSWHKLLLSEFLGLNGQQSHSVSLFHLLLALFYSMSTVDNDFFLHLRRLLHRYHGNFFLSIFVRLCVSVFQVWWVISSQVLTQMDQQDEQGGRMEEIYQQLKSAYCQFRLISQDLCKSGHMDHQGDQNSIRIHSQWSQVRLI